MKVVAYYNSSSGFIVNITASKRVLSMIFLTVYFFTCVRIDHETLFKLLAGPRRLKYF